MKIAGKYIGVAVLAGFLVLAFLNCKDPSEPNNYIPDDRITEDKTISIAEIQGVTAPVAGGIPITTITENEQYTGTVLWSPVDSTFQNSTVYFATITLTPKKGYTLQGVKADFFTVTGANDVKNDKNSGVITVIFPRTAGTIDIPAKIDIKTIVGINIVVGETPKTEINPTAQYTGTVVWSPADSQFKINTIYTATITLTPRAGFTFTGVGADFFTVMGAYTVRNEANSGVVKVEFTVNISIDNLAAYLNSQPANTTATPYFILLKIGTNDFSKLRTILNNAPNKYVYLDLSGSGVTSISKEAFSFWDKADWKGCTTLTGITIPNGVTSIEDNAFCRCSGLTSITIPNSVTSIGDYAFDRCTGLTSVTIPNSVTSIGDSAFGGCTGLTSVTVPNSVIYLSGFNGCTGLTSITIPNSVTTIGESAFFHCIGLTSITIPNSVTSIGDYAFDRCTGLTSITIPNSVTSIGDGYNSGGRPRGMFSSCTSLTSVNFATPSKVTRIGDYTFAECNALTSITIPDSVTSIGEYAFYYCRGLTSVNFATPSKVTRIEDFAFFYCTGLTSVTIPNSVTSIGDYAFDGCTGLTSITIPNSVTSIGDVAFGGCTGLTSVTIPNSVTSIGDYAFDGCTGLTSITIPNSVTSIGDGAFRYCNNFTSITIGSGVTSIGDYAFFQCYGLTGSLTIPDSVTSIGESAFVQCYFTNITIPKSVTSIGNSAFMGCVQLISVTFSTGSNISDGNFGSGAFPEENYSGGNTLKTAYKNANPKSGEYTRAVNGSTWTKVD